MKFPELRILHGTHAKELQNFRLDAAKIKENISKYLQKEFEKSSDPFKNVIVLNNQVAEYFKIKDVIYNKSETT